MHNRLDILRVPPAPMDTPMYVFFNKTQDQIDIYRDKNCTLRIGQPILMRTSNIHFYCKENVRVDIKMISNVYGGGFLLIEDQLMINQDTYLDRIFTFNDTSNVVDSDGNILVEEL